MLVAVRKTAIPSATFSLIDCTNWHVVIQCYVSDRLLSVVSAVAGGLDQVEWLQWSRGAQ